MLEEFEKQQGRGAFQERSGRCQPPRRNACSLALVLVERGVNKNATTTIRVAAMGFTGLLNQGATCYMNSLLQVRLCAGSGCPGTVQDGTTVVSLD